VTLTVPFALYLLADEVGAYGVLAVLVAGLYLRATMTRELTPAGWLLGRSVWEYVDFAVSGVLFGFLGIELTSVLENAGQVGESDTLVLAAAVVAVLLLSRAVAMFTASAVAGRSAQRTGAAVPYGPREAAVATWAGMRGVVTVATALALPVVVQDGSQFPERETVILVALLVVIATLVVQGLTLAPLIRRLGVGSDEDESADARNLGLAAARAALRTVRAAVDVPDEVRATVSAQYESRLRHRDRMRDLVTGEGDGAQAAEALRSLLARAAEAEREVVLHARDSGTVSPTTADRVLYDIEARARQLDW
jgi:monovalent cation/hydrogen antiporter